MSNAPKTGQARKTTAARKTATARKTAAQRRTEAEEHKSRQEALEARVRREWQESVDDATEVLEALEETVTQREWLLITIKLDRTREQIAADGSLRLLALAWVSDKRAHGGADWDALLEMTDKDLVAKHGFPTEEPEETIKRLQAAAQEPGTEDPAEE